jgi:hypothetical protein
MFPLPMTLSWRVTRDPNREVLRRKTVQSESPFVRSTFDWAVCSEPLAVCGGRGTMGIEWWNSRVSAATKRGFG